jgi:hypothetical protein
VVVVAMMMRPLRPQQWAQLLFRVVPVFLVVFLVVFLAARVGILLVV